MPNIIFDDRPVSVDGRKEEILFRDITDPTHIKVAIMKYPDYIWQYSMITPNSTRRHHKKRPTRRWKSFQHYSSEEGVSQPSDNRFLVMAISSVPDPEHINPPTVYRANIDIGQFIDPFEVFGQPTSEIFPNRLLVTGEAVDRIPLPDILDSGIEASLRHMIPSIKSELSLINSLIELKDFVTLKPTINRIAETARLFFKKPIAGKTLRFMTGTAADGYLQAKFNFQPLFSDIAGVHRAITTAASRIDKLLLEEGKSITKHFRFEFDEFADDPPRTVVWSPEGVATRLSWRDGPALFDLTGQYLVSESLDESKPSQFHAQLRYRTTYSEVQRELAHALAFSDALGIQMDPAIIWNAIPWSFVVDWVANVAQFLHSIAPGNMTPQINILEFLWSVKRQRRTTWTHYVVFPRVDGTDSAVLQIIPRRYFYQSAYRRQVGMPDASLFQTSGLSLTEFSLASALVIAPGHKPKRHRAGR